MALPYDEGRAFIRTPDKYPHDAFGADTGGRTMPHTGIDVSPITKGDTTVRIRSVTSGRVEAQGWDKEAGYYVIIREKDSVYWGYGHNSKNLVNVGDAIAPGQIIAQIGATGGALGVHCHIWRAVSRDAAMRIVNGYTNLKNGRTTAAWAASMGLTDPLPAIRESIKEEDDMFSDLDRATLNKVYSWLQEIHPQVWAIQRNLSLLPDDADEAEAIASAVAAKLNTPGITPDMVAAISKAVVDEQAKRLNFDG